MMITCGLMNELLQGFYILVALTKIVRSGHCFFSRSHASPSRHYMGILTRTVVHCRNQNLVLPTYRMTGFGCPEQNLPEIAEATFHYPDVRLIHRQQAAHEECHSVWEKTATKTLDTTLVRYIRDAPKN
jgi:hypothetical protein